MLPSSVFGARLIVSLPSTELHHEGDGLVSVIVTLTCLVRCSTDLDLKCSEPSRLLSLALAYSLASIYTRASLHTVNTL